MIQDGLPRRIARRRDGGAAPRTPGPGDPPPRGELRDSPAARRMAGDLGALRALRAAPSPMVPLSRLVAEVCAACAAQDVQVGRYPAYRSAVFAGQLLVQCRCCGLAWVPGGGALDLDAGAPDDLVDGGHAPDAPSLGADRAARGQAARRRRDRSGRPVGDLARFGPFGRVLDIGAGAGMLADLPDTAETWTAHPGRHVRRAATQEPGLRSTSLPDAAAGRAGGPFDLIVAAQALERLDHTAIASTLGLVRQSLRRGGVFFAEVPAGADQLTAFAQGRRPPRARIEPQVLFFSALSLVRLARQAGLDVLEVGPCAWTAAHVSPHILREIAGGATLLPAGPLTLLAQAP